MIGHLLVLFMAVYEPINCSTQKLEAQLYGDLDAYAYYFVDLLIGQPQGQRVSAIVDTGSTLGALACSHCAHCGTHLDANFNFLASETSRWVMCSHSSSAREEKAVFQCPTCRSGKCSYEQSYREGSSLSGNFFTDLVRIGNSENIPIRATLGCHTDERKLFFSQQANGILGLAPHRQGRADTVLEILFQQVPKLFALCLASEGGQLTIGDSNKKLHSTVDIVWTDMTVGNFYNLQPQKISVHGESVGTSFGTTIVDSGTTFTYFPSNIYKSIKTAISRNCETKQFRCAQKMNENCWADPEDFPVIKLHFTENKFISWRAKHGYLYPKAGKWCYSFEDSLAVETVLGASFMLYKDFIFDLGGSPRLGFVESDCPVVSHRDKFAPQPEHTSVVPDSPPVSQTTTTTTKTPQQTSQSIDSSTAEEEEKERPSADPEKFQIPGPSHISPLFVLYFILLGLAMLAVFLRRRRAHQYEQTNILTATVGHPRVLPEYADVWLQPVVVPSD